ncbi:helix-turn-helix transcriptional regulator [Rubrobacter indicoceani]|uniref:helix-turn-helix transcriptional regulator n=1 Tax=Rubrobacter indicoceani TaxID=2051957 RepID=UPI000E5B39C1|nr:WYL domain-containing protein [Rubrobacter indicoceani]
MGKRSQTAAARQLSLVAYLLSSGGRERDEREIRENLPFYREVYESSLGANKGSSTVAADALRKQLSRDVEALSNVGVPVSVEGRNEGRSYSLTSRGFSPVEVELNAQERAVLIGALRSLRRDFPYLGPLKLAIANMIGAASEEAGSPEEAAAFAAVATRDDERVSSRLAVLERAISRRRRVKFDYYAINSGETGERELEPYALSLLDGVWYVTGWDTNRRDVRQFRLSRVQGRVVFATKGDSSDFTTPENFERRLVGPRAPWQLGEPDKTAHIRVSEEAFGAQRRRYGFAVSLAGRGDDGGRIVLTRYSGERQLAGWVLSLGEEARALSPESLVSRVEEGLQKIVGDHAGGAS